MVTEHINDALESLELAHESCDTLGTQLMIEEAMGNIERIKENYDSNANG